ncbi:MAG: glycosyltransferase involved in cell wall biosynthesis [Polaribacter sp.]|jgi:glycosyltransferase involved in cell wall biosynthesis
MPNLAFDAKRLFNNPTGLGNYARTLLKNLTEYHPDHQYHLYSPRIKKQAYNEFFRKSPAFQNHTAGRTPAALWRSYRVKKDLLKNKVDLYHGLSHEIPIGLSDTKIKTVVSIHDLIIKTYPHTFKAIDRAIYDWKFSYACREADHIIAISEHTKRDIIKYYGTSADKISVVYQTCGEQFKIIHAAKHIQTVQQRYQLPAEYLLYVGSIVERKNLLPLLEAIRLLPKTVQLPLVVVGQGSGAYFKKVQDYIRQQGIRVYFPQGVSNEDLPAIYQGAQIFCYPSSYEGFGIPILEALYSKVPVVTSPLSSLPEAAGPDAFYADPKNKEELSEAINNVLTNSELRSNSIKKGFEHAQQFDARTLTDQVMNIYLQQLQNPI